MSICVTGSAPFCRNEHFTGNKCAGRSRCISGRERIRTEFEVVRFCYLGRIGILANVIVGICRNLPASHEYRRGHTNEN